MNQQQLKQTRVQLYKATPLKLQLVDELISLIKGCFGGKVETNEIQFDSGNFKLTDKSELSVNMIELDPQEIGGVLIHWYPNFYISTKNDPYCSVYMLSIREIRKIIHRVKNIQEYYNSHQTR